MESVATLLETVLTTKKGITAFEVSSLLNESFANATAAILKYCEASANSDNFDLRYTCIGRDRGDNHLVIHRTLSRAAAEECAQDLDGAEINLYAVTPKFLDASMKSRTAYGFKASDLVDRTYPTLSREDSAKSFKRSFSNMSLGAMDLKSGSLDSMASPMLPMATTAGPRSQPMAAAAKSASPKQVPASAPVPVVPKVTAPQPTIVATSPAVVVAKPAVPAQAAAAPIVVEDTPVKAAAPVAAAAAPAVVEPIVIASADPSVQVVEAPAPQKEQEITSTVASPPVVEATPTITTAPAPPVEEEVAKEKAGATPTEQEASSPAAVVKKPSAFDMLKQAPTNVPKKSKAKATKEPKGEPKSRGRPKKEKTNDLSKMTKTGGKKSNAMQRLVDSEDENDSEAEEARRFVADAEMDAILSSVNDDIMIPTSLEAVAGAIPKEVKKSPSKPAATTKKDAADEDASPGAKRPRAQQTQQPPAIQHMAITRFCNPALLAFQRQYKKFSEEDMIMDGDEMVFRDVTKYKCEATGDVLTEEEFRAKERELIETAAESPSPAGVGAAAGASPQDDAAGTAAEADKENPAPKKPRTTAAKKESAPVKMRPLTDFFKPKPSQ